DVAGRDLHRGDVVAARDLVGAEVGGLLEGEVAGQALAEHVDRQALGLEAQVRAGGQGADRAERRVDREREGAGEADGGGGGGRGRAGGGGRWGRGRRRPAAAPASCRR